jgi:hypothetical protein
VGSVAISALSRDVTLLRVKRIQVRADEDTAAMNKEAVGMKATREAQEILAAIFERLYS